jgi:hypothetical protein
MNQQYDLLPIPDRLPGRTVLDEFADRDISRHAKLGRGGFHVSRRRLFHGSASGGLDASAF